MTQRAALWCSEDETLAGLTETLDNEPGNDDGSDLVSLRLAPVEATGNLCR